MNLRDLYYRLRPLAKVRAERRYEVDPNHERVPMHPAASFVLSASCSLIGGFVGGVFLWFALGFNPENSGGTFIFLGGAILMSVISVVSYALFKNRAVFYGLNAFTALTLLGLAASAAESLFA